MGLADLFRGFMTSGKVDIARRYEILRDAVSGTMSDFHMARDRETGEIVGLKILDKKKTEALEQHMRWAGRPLEGDIALSMQHPRIVVTQSHGLTTNGEQFIVMEFLDGPGLNSLIIGRSKLLEGNRLALMTQAAEAIAYVHQQGYIHRDVCPRNFVCEKDAANLKLIDFGLTVPAKPEFLQPGMRTGTPNYMAPEVVRRKATDHRLDIYAYGASMYELFAFELPWQRGADGLAAMSHGNHDAPPLSKYFPNVNPEVEEVILKCLKPAPSDRWPSMDAVVKALKRVKSETV